MVGATPRETSLTKLAQGYLLRATRLDSCGRIQYGDRVDAVSDGFVTVAATTQTTSVDEIALPNARGKNILRIAPRTDLAGYGIEVQFGQVDPELFEIVTGQGVVYDAFGTAIGFTISTDVDTSQIAWALEVWTGAVGGDACDDENATGSWGYFLYPFLKGGVLGDHTIQNGAITFTITSVVTADGNHWGVGPYDVILDEAGDPSPLLVALGANVHELVIPTGYAPPEVFVGARPLMDPAWASITTITPEYETGSYEVGLAAGVADPTHGVWWDFGDGTWDFVPGNGDTIHEFPDSPTPHTYTVTASAKGGQVVSQAVTVPGA